MKTIKKPQVFIVNMAQDREKKAYMIKLCHKRKISPTFIKAVIGSKLHSRLENDIHNFKHVNHRLSKEEIGCALSHISIYKTMIENKIPVALILEDDIDIGVDIGLLLDQLILFTENWHTILLGHHSISSRTRPTKGSKWRVTKLSTPYKLLFPCEVSGGTYGYLINLEGAKKLLSELSNLDKPIDHYTGSNKHCNLFLLSPPIIKINEDMSDNFTSMPDRSRTSYTGSSSSLVILIKKIFTSMGIYKTFDVMALNVKLTLKSFKPIHKYKP